MLRTYNVKGFGFTKEERVTILRLEAKFLLKYGMRLQQTPRSEREKLARQFLREEPELGGAKKGFLDKAVAFIAGYSDIEPLLKDPEVEEVLINGWERVLIHHRQLGKCETNVKFGGEDELMRFITKLTTYCGSEKGVVVDASMPEGPRINITLPPVSFRRPVITIRKFMERLPSVIDLLLNKTLTPEVAALLWMCIDGFGLSPRNILIAGGTSSGKTTMLNVLLTFVREHERVVTIEDTLELNLEFLEDWVRLRTSEHANMEKLVENALRMRPDRIVVGEVRGREAYNMLNAMNLGHKGFGTIHAETAREAVLKLTSPPMNVEPKMLRVLGLIVVMARFQLKDKCLRRVTSVEEVGGVVGDQVQLSDLYRYNAKTGKLEFVRFPAMTFNWMAEALGLTPKDVINETKRREVLLRYMVDQRITKLEDVLRFVRSYYERPKDVWEKVAQAFKASDGAAGGGQTPLLRPEG